MSEIQDVTEYSLAGREFNMLTPGNEMKWDATEKVPGIKNYTSADIIVKYAKQHSMRLRGHCLVWHSQVPGWVNGLSKEKLQNAMESRIKYVENFVVVVKKRNEFVTISTDIINICR